MIAVAAALGPAYRSKVMRALLALPLLTACVRPHDAPEPRPPAPAAPRPELERDALAAEVSASDRCPDALENLNGIEDDDGCPEPVPADLAAVLGVISGLKFSLNKDTITAGREVLIAAAEVLRRYPGTLIEVGGHISPPKDEYYRVDLSSRRADAVRRFFLEQGVPAAQLIARGYGDERPIDTHKTEAGRQRNRRIELTLVERPR